MLTGAFKADWIQLPIESYLAVFPTLRGVQTQRCLSLADHGREDTSLPVPSPINNRWTTGIQRSMLCPRCGLTSPWWGSTICARWLGYLACGALFVRGGGFCSSILRQLGRDRIRRRRGRRGSLPTGPINLGMIWKMKSELMTIGMLGESGRQPGTVSYRYVSLVPHWSFLVSKESFRASMTRSGKKSMFYRYSFLEVNKMCQLAEWKRGSKARMLLLAQSPAEEEVRAGVSCRQSWEPDLVSPFHHDRSWTCFGVFCLFVGVGLFFWLCCLKSMTFP